MFVPIFLWGSFTGIEVIVQQLENITTALKVYDTIHVKLVSIQSKQCAKPAHDFWDISSCLYIDWLVQERCYFSALALELHISCTNPSICETNFFHRYETKRNHFGL